MKPLLKVVLLASIVCLGHGAVRKDRVVVVISLDGFPASALWDNRLAIPTLRRLAREGSAARGMRVSNPSVTWPNHTTMVTGVSPDRHGVLFNGMLLRQGPRSPVKVEPWRDKGEMVRVPTIYDLAYRAGLTTAQVDWVAIQKPGTITWAFPEVPDPHNAVEQEMVSSGLITTEELTEFARLPVTMRDEYWTRAAVHIIRKHRPNLVLVHFLNLDSIHHRYGPNTPAGMTAIAYADTRIGAILRALEDARLLERSTVFVVSDHGFKSTRRSIRPNVLLREQGLLKVEGGSIICDAYVVPEGGTAMVYVTDPSNRALVPKLRSLFQSVEGVDRVLGPADFPALGLPRPEEYSQMADLVLAAKDGYAFAAAHEGSPVVEVPESGAHGYLSTDPALNALFVAWGKEIRKGVVLDVVNNLDLAPTIASLLGIQMEGVAGRKLDAILVPEKR
jgi:predicted AlkP superfamily pyrophosphatase or phosphodiesterase